MNLEQIVGLLDQLAKCENKQLCKVENVNIISQIIDFYLENDNI